jgi:hypothetical protein
LQCIICIIIFHDDVIENNRTYQFHTIYSDDFKDTYFSRNLNDTTAYIITILKYKKIALCNLEKIYLIYHFSDRDETAENDYLIMKKFIGEARLKVLAKELLPRIYFELTTIRLTTKPKRESPSSLYSINLGIIKSFDLG